jgi:hypothetical protein
LSLYSWQLEACFFLVLIGGIDCGILWYGRDLLALSFRDYSRFC